MRGGATTLTFIFRLDILGLGAGTLLVFNGDILGASGLLSSVTLAPGKISTDPHQHWKLVLLSSFVVTAGLVFGPGSVVDERSLDRNNNIPIASALGHALGGLLVGLGESDSLRIIEWVGKRMLFS